MATPIQAGTGLINPALRKAGVMLAPGRTPSPEQYADALGELNRLVGNLNCDRLNIYSVATQQFSLDPPKPSYTIGISTPPADFPVARPQGIEAANIIGDGGSSPIRYRLAIVTADQWAEITYPMLPGTIPTVLYNDRASPVSTLYLYGQPAPGQLLELFTWTMVPTFSAVTDAVELPPGYEDAIVLNLAVRLAPQYQLPVHPDVRLEARLSLMRVESINAPRPVAEFAGFGCGCGNDWNIYSGE